MRIVLIVLLLLVVANTFIGDGRILRNVSAYQSAWDALRVVFYIAGVLLLTLLFLDVAIENFHQYPYDPPSEEEEEPEKAGDSEEDEEALTE